MPVPHLPARSVAEAVANAHDWFEVNTGWAPPDDDTLAEWVHDGVCRCPDECLVTPDAWCDHGLASWWLILRPDSLPNPSAAGAVREVVRVGPTVRRPAGWWTRSVHDLLHHARDHGFGGAPIPMGFDVAGREVLSFIEGDAGAASWSHIVGDDGLARYARFLRRYHDVVAGYRPRPDAAWSDAVGRPRRGELMCHGDPAPWNVVWRDGQPVGLIDWDHARPGPATDDVAWALVWATPLRPDAEAVDGWDCWATPPDRRRRLALFADAYGLDASVDELLDFAVARLHLDIAMVRRLAGRGLEPQVTWVAEGFDAAYLARIAWIEEHRPALR